MKETKFKNTEIGMIPEEWEVYPLSSLVSDIADGPFGSNLKTEHYISEKEVRVVQLSNIGDDGWHDSNTKYTSFAHASTLSRCIIPTGSILIAKMMPAGRAIICPKIDSQYILGSDVVRITCDTKLDPKYFVYNTKSKLYLEQISECTQGSTRQRTSISKLKTIQIVVPPTREQDSIASALTSIDNLISSLGKLIEKKKNIKQGAMQQLLTGKTRLKGFNEPWVEKKLGEVCSVKRGVRVVKRNLTTDGLYPVYQNTNIPLGYSNQCNVEANTPFVIIGGSAGQVGICRERYWAADDCAFFACHDIYKEYLYYVLLLNQSNILHNVRTGTIPRLDRTFLSGMLVYISSNIAEQQAIATILTKMENEITALEAKRAKYEAIKQGMMQQLLTGKIRLIS